MVNMDLTPGEAVLVLRRRKGMSQGDLASGIRRSVSLVSSIESGGRGLSSSVALRLTEMFPSLTLRELLSESSRNATCDLTCREGSNAA